VSQGGVEESSRHNKNVRLPTVNDVTN